MFSPRPTLSAKTANDQVEAATIDCSTKIKRKQSQVYRFHFHILMRLILLILADPPFNLGNENFPQKTIKISQLVIAYLLHIFMIAFN